jgi:hypothetical protein
MFLLFSSRIHIFHNKIFQNKVRIEQKVPEILKTCHMCCLNVNGEIGIISKTLGRRSIYSRASCLFECLDDFKWPKMEQIGLECLQQLQQNAKTEKDNACIHILILGDIWIANRCHNANVCVNWYRLLYYFVWQKKKIVES